MKYIVSIPAALLAICLAGCKAQYGGKLFIESRKDNKDSVWSKYEANTVNTLPGFTQRKEPPTSGYGGWKDWRAKATGFFRTEKVKDRWWIIDPDGYPYIHKAVVAFNPGKSEKQKQTFQHKFGTLDSWVQQSSDMLKGYGFNGAGAWTNVDLLRQQKQPLVYTLIISPMGAYHKDHLKKFGGKYEEAGWQGYRYDLAMVFDKEFDNYIVEAVKPIAKYKNDKYLLGYFTDNELPWVFDALDRHLTKLGKTEQGYIAAEKWLKQRKGNNATVNDITDEDRAAFTAFYFDTYMKKVVTALRKADPNHLYLGCRFNQDKERQELSNPEIFKVAGRYMDIISVNHYRKWEPDQQIFDNWAAWSGKPVIITEWYTKAVDSGLPNNTGAGWLVHSQKDRGIFYQNFTLGLLRNKNCVGWHWFKYMDNDPEDKTTDPSNRDSNKGVVDRYFSPYTPLLEQMKIVNTNTYNLISYFDKTQQ
ncbi:hypothetical protein [Filimonas effusa]|nr:hypothetical protein [Filimonas effusa]